MNPPTNTPRITVKIEVVADCGTVCSSEYSSGETTMIEAASLMGYCFRAVDNFLTTDPTDDVVSEFANSAFQATDS
jgi:hypothetical protein